MLAPESPVPSVPECLMIGGPRAREFMLPCASRPDLAGCGGGGGASGSGGGPPSPLLRKAPPLAVASGFRTAAPVGASGFGLPVSPDFSRAPWNALPEAPVGASRGSLPVLPDLSGAPRNASTAAPVGTSDTHIGGGLFTSTSGGAPPVVAVAARGVADNTGSGGGLGDSLAPLPAAQLTTARGPTAPAAPIPIVAPVSAAAPPFPPQPLLPVPPTEISADACEDQQQNLLRRMLPVAKGDGVEEVAQAAHDNACQGAGSLLRELAKILGDNTDNLPPNMIQTCLGVIQSLIELGGSDGPSPNDPLWHQLETGLTRRLSISQMVDEVKLYMDAHQGLLSKQARADDN